MYNSLSVSFSIFLMVISYTRFLFGELFIYILYSLYNCVVCNSFIDLKLCSFQNTTRLIFSLGADSYKGSWFTECKSPIPNHGLQGSTPLELCPISPSLTSSTINHLLSPSTPAILASIFQIHQQVPTVALLQQLFCPPKKLVHGKPTPYFNKSLPRCNILNEVYSDHSAQNWFITQYKTDFILIYTPDSHYPALLALPPTACP